MKSDSGSCQRGGSAASRNRWGPGVRSATNSQPTPHRPKTRGQGRVQWQLATRDSSQGAPAHRRRGPKGGAMSPSTAAAAGPGPVVEGASWRELLAPYARPRLGRSLLDIATSVVPYLALSVLMYLSLDVSYLLTLALAVPTAGFLVRVFILFHDCSHGSLLPSRRANAWLGVALGLLVYAPFLRWRHDHAVHHATSGDLDRRGTGDIRTLTVAEYHALSRRGRIGYRLLRNPVVMFGLGPIVA